MKEVKFTQVVEFLVHHNVLIIEVLLGIIIFSVVFLSFRLFFRKAEAEIKGGVDDQALKAIEASLKKVLETAEVKAAVTTSSPSGESSIGGSVAEEFVQKLETEVATKAKLIEELQVQLQTVQEQAAASASSGGDVAQWKQKAGELEAKLAEYEIIAEDIADLSQYKEENARLKAEIDALKAGGAVAAAPAAAAAAPEAPAPAPTQAAAPVAAAPEAPVDDDIMAEFAKAVEDQKSGGLKEAEPASVAEAPPAAVDDDIMAEFAKAVEEQKSGDLKEPEVAPAAVAAAPAPEAPVDDDIMAEFAKAVEEQKSGDLQEPAAAEPAAAAVAEQAPVKKIEFGSPEEDEAIRQAALEAVAEASAPKPAEDPVEAVLASTEAAPAPESSADPGVDLGELNLEAMVAEAADLAVAPEAELAEAPNALEASLDTDKLAEEALTIQKVKPEDEKLMDQFEDFVKKGAS